MEGEITHPIFRDSLSPQTPLWRYMSFAKLGSLLQSKRLRFTRVDQFEDHFEGVWPRKDLEAWNKLSPLPAGVTEEMRRRRVAASCWINLPHESAGMWRLYGAGSEGVAIRTTFAKLQQATRGMEDAAPATLAGVAKVRYVDHATDSILSELGEGDPYPNILVPFMLKHVSYEYEHEVRALVVAPVTLDGGYDIDPAGCGTAPLVLEDFLDEIVTGPLSQPWFEETVVELATANGLTSVRRSVLHPRDFWQGTVSTHRG